MNNKQDLVRVQQEQKNKLNSMSIGNFLNNVAIKNRITSMLGSERGLRFITGVTSAVTNNPNLAQCTNDSIFNGALLGETLGLSPSPQLGQYYLVPFNDRVKGKVAQFQLGYKGYIQLAIRSGQYTKLNVLAIKEGELIKYDPLNEDIEVKLIDNELERENAKTIGYYAMFEYVNGFRKSMYWSKEKMLIHADTYSKAFNKDIYQSIQEGKIPQEEMRKYSSFWYKDFDGMAYKTMLRQLISKWGIMSVEMQKAYESDMALIQENGSPDYIDNKPDNEDQIIIEQNDDTVIEETEIEKPKTVSLNEL